MAIPNRQVKDGWYFMQANSVFVDQYLGPKLSYLWRYLHKDFIHFATQTDKKGKNWLYSYTKSTQAIAEGVGYGSRRQTVTEEIKQLEAKGVLCRIPCASNGNQGKAIVTFDPASIGYESFVHSVVKELAQKEGPMAKEYLSNFMSDLTQWKPTSAIVNDKGQTVEDTISILKIPNEEPVLETEKRTRQAKTEDYSQYDCMRDVPDDAW